MVMRPIYRTEIRKLSRQLARQYPDLKVTLDILNYLGLSPESVLSREDTPLVSQIIKAVRELPEVRQLALLQLIKKCEINCEMRRNSRGLFLDTTTFFVDKNSRKTLYLAIITDVFGRGSLS